MRDLFRRSSTFTATVGTDINSCEKSSHVAFVVIARVVGIVGTEWTIGRLGVGAIMN